MNETLTDVKKFSVDEYGSGWLVEGRLKIGVKYLGTNSADLIIGEEEYRDVYAGQTVT